MLASMLLACAVASAGQYQYPSSQAANPPVYYTPAAAAPMPTVLISAPPFWDRCLARTGAWLSARAALHQHPLAATLYVAPPRLATTCYAGAPAAVPLASGQDRVYRAEAEAVPPPPALQSTLPPPAPTSTLPPAANLTPEQKLSEIRRLLLGP